MGVVVSRETFRALREALPAETVVVMTNGCFDVLHAGHLRLLHFARSLGDVMVVALNSDRSVRELKGEERPFLPQGERADALGALWAVSFVIVFDELRADRTIEAVRPHVYCRGGDAAEAIPELPTIRKVGARVELMPLVEDRSTSRIAARIRAPGDSTG
jgi:rfaE bifunctional protein nucleotidyltransferase chain/domain